MSTMIALFLVLSALAGCAGETLTNVKNALPAPPAAAAVFSVEMEEYEKTIRDGNGTVLAECAYELPVLRALTEDGNALEAASSGEGEEALAAVETFNAHFGQWKSNPQTLAESAKADWAFRNETGLTPVAYTDDLRCTVYQTEKLISVSGVYSTYTGGAHPNSILMSWNFDLESGEFLETEILDKGGDLREYVHQALVNRAQEAAAEMGTAASDYYWEDYADILADWPSYAVSFDQEGMTVAFSPYELACYAAGPQVFQLSYGELLPHLDQHGRALLGLEEEPAGETR